MLVLICLLISGCTYSHWNYFPFPESIEHPDWEIESSFHSISYYQQHFDEEGDELKTDEGDTLFVYTITLSEPKTTPSRQFSIEVDNVAVSFERANISLNIPRFESPRILPSTGFHEMPAVYDTYVRFGPIRIPKPRPESLFVTQDIVVRNTVTLEEVERLHITTVAKLKRYRFDRFTMILEGT